MIYFSHLLGFIVTVLVFVALQPERVEASADRYKRGRLSVGSDQRTAAVGREKIDSSSEVKRLLSAAKEKNEQELNFVWDGASLGGTKGAKIYESLFNRMYGTDIKINFTPGPNMPAMAAKLTQEVAAGQRNSTDVFVGTVEHFGSLVDRNVLEEYDYMKLTPRVTKEMVAPRNIGVEIFGSMGGVIYNTTLVSQAEAPKKLEDVLNPKWKGRIASTPVAAYFNRVAMRPEWGVERMKGFITELAKSVGGLINVGEAARVVSGEFVMLVLGSLQEFNHAKSQGAPVEFVMPEDAAVVHFGLLGVPRNSNHSHLGKLFINMVLSEEGQKAVYEAHKTDHYALPGSQSAARLSALRAKGIEPLRVNVKFVADHPEMSKLQAELQKILREKR